MREHVNGLTKNNIVWCSSTSAKRSLSVAEAQTMCWYHYTITVVSLQRSSAKHHTNIDTWQNFHMFLIHSLNCGSALHGQDDNALSKWRFTHLPIQYESMVLKIQMYISGVELHLTERRQETRAFPSGSICIIGVAAYCLICSQPSF